MKFRVRYKVDPPEGEFLLLAVDLEKAIERANVVAKHILQGAIGMQIENVEGVEEETPQYRKREEL